jgi:catechol 2,3-dioxygenase-like lactoylglutathione lyase family enzyme
MRYLVPLFVALIASAQERPPIVGVAHIGLKTDDLAAARQFYGHVLGYQEPFTVDKPSGGLMLTYFKVNDHQYIEVFPELKSPAEDRLSHIAFETTNIQQLRDYLASKGVKAPDARCTRACDGNLSMMLKDPDGHNVEFVEYRPGSLHTKNFGKFLPDTRVSERIIHVGITVADRAAADRFYQDILGFHDIWHGGMHGRPHGLGGYAGAGWDRLAGVHAQRAQPVAALAGRDASPGAGRAERGGRLQDGGRARDQSGEAQDWPRWEMAAQSVRSEWHARGIDGAEAGGEAVLLADIG